MNTVFTSQCRRDVLCACMYVCDGHVYPLAILSPCVLGAVVPEVGGFSTDAVATLLHYYIDLDISQIFLLNAAVFMKSFVGF